MSGAEVKGRQAERAPCPLAPHLSVAQHWVSSLHSRHGQRETFQPPQEAAEVIVATHGCCQGLLTCAGVLRRRGTVRRPGPYRSSPKPHHCHSHLGFCHRASTPSAGHYGKCSLAEVASALHLLPNSTAQATLQPLAVTPALTNDPYLFWALDQCIQKAPHIVDTGIWDVGMAGKGAQHRLSVGTEATGISYWILAIQPKAWAGPS